MSHIPVPAWSGPELVTRADVAAKLAVEEPFFGPDVEALAAAVADANTLVLSELGWDDITGKTPVALGIATAVARRVAARLWRNPMDAASQSAEGASLAWSDPRILTGDERRALRPARIRTRGPIRTLPPDDEEPTP